MKKLYWRCNGGHYFSSERCPFDGWTSPELKELFEASQHFQSNGIVPGLAALQADGVSDSALQRVIVIEFGSEKAVFEAISPERYILGGNDVKLAKAGPNFR